MSDETQLPEDIQFPTPPLRPDQLADSAGPGLIWLWQGFLAQQKVTALISQSKSGKTALTSHLLPNLLPAVVAAIMIAMPPNSPVSGRRLIRQQRGRS